MTDAMPGMQRPRVPEGGIPLIPRTTEAAAAGAATAASYLWPSAVSLTILLAIMAGGSTQALTPALTILRLACVGLLAVGVLRLWRGQVTLPVRLALSLMMLSVGLVTLHLAPLPGALYGALPGRAFVTSTYAMLGLADAPALPFTLSTAGTQACLLAVLLPISLFVATLSIAPGARWMPVAAILTGAVISVLLGLVQRFQGPGSNLYFHAYSNVGSATGFFANRNHLAALLYVAIPLSWSLTQKFHNRAAGFAFGAVMTFILLAGLGAAASRAGIFLGMLALLLSMLMLWALEREDRKAKRLRLSFIAMVGGALVIGQFGMIGILRLAETDPLTEFRATISDVTLQAAARFFPLGSGFGTFLPVYGMHETPPVMVSNYVNHAHNDWLELWLEGGLPAALLLAGFVALFTYQSWRIWKSTGTYAHDLLPRAASICVLLLLLHSFVDYPLRMPALASIFGLLLGLMFSHAAPKALKVRARRRSRSLAQAPAPLQPRAPAVAPAFKVHPPSRQQP